MGSPRYYTIVLVPDGTETRRDFRIRKWVLRLIVAVFAAVLIGIAVFFILYGKVLSRAALTEKLMAEFCIRLILNPFLLKIPKISSRLFSLIKEKSWGDVRINT